MAPRELTIIRATLRKALPFSLDHDLWLEPHFSEKAFWAFIELRRLVARSSSTIPLDALSARWGLSDGELDLLQTQLNRYGIASVRNLHELPEHEMLADAFDRIHLTDDLLGRVRQDLQKRGWARVPLAEIEGPWTTMMARLRTIEHLDLLVKDPIIEEKAAAAVLRLTRVTTDEKSPYIEEFSFDFETSTAAHPPGTLFMSEHVDHRMDAYRTIFTDPRVGLAYEFSRTTRVARGSLRACRSRFPSSAAALR